LVGEVLKIACESAGEKGHSIWYSDVRLNCDHPFADYFEPEAIYAIKLAIDFPEGSLMLNASEKLEGFGIDLTKAKLLMDVKGRFDMEEFVTKVVEPEASPTVLLLEWQPGFVVGGLAALPWPKRESQGAQRCYAADPEKKSFMFSLEPKARRFDLVRADKALLRWTDGNWRSFKFGNDLYVSDDGDCAGQSTSYSGERDDGSFPKHHFKFTRFELWAL
jgi:hypothetical protein